MSSESKGKITLFQKYLSIWILLSMIIGVLLGYYIPGLAHALESATLSSVSIPIAILLCKINFY
jgi:ACR3 family arsenite transporter